MSYLVFDFIVSFILYVTWHRVLKMVLLAILS